MPKCKLALRQTLNNFKNSLPLLVGIIFLIALLVNLISSEFLEKILTGNKLADTFIATVIGSILAGNPINSYIISSELLAWGVSLTAVTAFIISWVTVGIVQLPAEILLLGKNFALTRNILCFFSAILIAFLTTLLISVI
ncbi:MAG: hypothetical protein JW740_00740 [Candidatus Zambryskibacteria bacterium]|nr:hypothetical protein [Candidatus Zambryskibacteria bacterium]